MKSWRPTPKNLCISAAVAALYALLTLALEPLSYGSVQCRLSEALTIMPLFLAESVPGLFVGCFLANFLAPAVVLPDVIFGSLATLAAAILTYKLRGRSVFVAMLPPVLVNAVAVGILVHVYYAPEVPLALCMLQVGAGQALAVYTGGGALYAALRKTNIGNMPRV